MSNLQQSSKEIWKDVPGSNGSYQINQQGHIKSVARFAKNRNGILNKPVKEIIIKPFIDSGGYWHVILRIDGKSVHFKIHRLLAILFIPNPQNKSQVNHKNGIKHDCRLENLEWVTPSENNRHAYKTGLMKPAKGSRNAASKFTEEQVVKILKLRGVLGTDEIGNMFGVGRWAVESIFRGDTWSHLSGIKKRKRDENRRIIENRQCFNRYDPSFT